jgi:putative endonuclease
MAGAGLLGAALRALYPCTSTAALSAAVRHSLLTPWALNRHTCASHVTFADLVWRSVSIGSSSPPTAGRPRPSRPPGRVDPRRALGRHGEGLAADHLRRLGFSPLGRNQRTRYGEIDLIAFDGCTLVFAEVKTRRVTADGMAHRPDQQPLSWLRDRQRARLRRLAVAWLSGEGRIRPTARTIRFDAIGVTVDAQDRLLRIDHIEAAW